jgi:hypothetical protein
VAGHNGGVPDAYDPAQQASFLAYLHYVEDLAGIIGGRFGVADSLVHGIYDAAAGATGTVPPARARQVQAHLTTAWRNLVRLEQLTAPAAYDRQVNAVAPRFAFEAVIAAVRALAAAEGADLAQDPGDVLDYAGGRLSEGLLPYPWSARCAGCPQAGSVGYEDVAPGEVSVFATPDPTTSEARLALLLRTTRARALEQAFAEARRRGVRPGRSRRNLSWAEKESIAAATAPTTLLDLFARLHVRAAEDGGDALVDGAWDDVEAFRFAEALRLVADATVAALEAVIARRISWELLGDLAGSHLRRGEVASPTLRRRVSAAAEVAVRASTSSRRP